MSIWTIYLITHRDSDRKYVGITKAGVTKRWGAHKNGVKLQRFKEHPLYIALRACGAATFSISSLSTTMCLEKAGMLEARYIQEYKTLAPEGFNVNPGGIRGYAAGKRSKEFRKACSERALRQFADPAQRERVRQEQLLRWKDEVVAKSYNEGRARAYRENPQLIVGMREALRIARSRRKKKGGWKLSEETRKKMSAGRNRVAMSQRAKAQWADPVKRAALMAARKH